MRKGKLGISLGFYAVLSFVLAFMGQTTLCFLLLGFVLVAERDEWASRQVMQAAFLSLVSSLVNDILSIFDILNQIPIIYVFLSDAFALIRWAVSVVILVFIIIALVKVCKGKDAGLPGLSTLAERAFGLVAQKVYSTTPPAGGQPQQQAYPYNQPQQPVQPNNQNQNPQQ